MLSNKATHWQGRFLQCKCHLAMFLNSNMNKEYLEKVTSQMSLIGTRLCWRNPSTFLCVPKITVQSSVVRVKDQTCLSGIKLNLNTAITLTTVFFQHQPFNVKIPLVWVVSPSYNPLVGEKHFSLFERHLFAFQGIRLALKRSLRKQFAVSQSLCVQKSISTPPQL